MKTFPHAVLISLLEVDDLDLINVWLYGQGLKIERDFTVGPVRICTETFEVTEKTYYFKSLDTALLFKLTWGGL